MAHICSKVKYDDVMELEFQSMEYGYLGLMTRSCVGLNFPRKEGLDHLYIKRGGVKPYKVGFKHLYKERGNYHI